MRRIDSSARTVRQLMDGVKYTIDFYQREYAWQDQQVSELIDDLVHRFMGSYAPGHGLKDVQNYGYYFLGAIVTNHKRGRRLIVDGQQRLTTLGLIFICLHRLQAGRADAVPIHDCVYTTQAGRKAPNIEVPERMEVMLKLVEGAPTQPDGQSASVTNIIQQYRNIEEHLPRELAAEPLPLFVTWLCDNVSMVEIETYSDEDAYTIFETMNDRGASLRPPELLKGYILANIEPEPAQREANEVWRRHMQAFEQLGDEEDVRFFKSWFNAQYASSIRPRRSGAVNMDYERITTDFHRWLRDHHEEVGLLEAADFECFVTTDLDFYARHALAIRKASAELVEGWESIYYNANRRLSLQLQVLLAPLSPGDSDEVVWRKVALVADFLDIWAARRIWNFKAIKQTSVKYTLFLLTKELRGQTLARLPGLLRTRLAQQPETFTTEPNFRLRSDNQLQVHHILARFTHWVETRCGRDSDFAELVREGRGDAFDVEHLWPDEYAMFADRFEYPPQFEHVRNRIGGLVLVRRGLSRNLRSDTFRRKVHAYVTRGERLLARSLHKSAYKHGPELQELIEETGLPFKAYLDFSPEDQIERQRLYIRMAEWIWNPSRLDADGEKAPVYEPIFGQARRRAAFAPRFDRHLSCLRFWQALLPVSRERHALHAHLKPTRAFRLGTGVNGQSWNYVLMREETRVEFFLEAGDALVNKTIFDALAIKRREIDAAFGEPLIWDRVDDKRVCRVSVNIHGGWEDEPNWPDLIHRAVDAMSRLNQALAPWVQRLNEGEVWGL